MPWPPTPRQYWIDNFDPWIVRFNGDWGIRRYGVAYILGFLITLLIWNRWAERGRQPVAPMTFQACFSMRSSTGGI